MQHCATQHNTNKNISNSKPKTSYIEGAANMTDPLVIRMWDAEKTQYCWHYDPYMDKTIPNNSPLLSKTQAITIKNHV